ncbi:ATP-dependent zinc protease family protein [Pirellulaceae bacterium SH467]|jgi:hypothetical protein
MPPFNLTQTHAGAFADAADDLLVMGWRESVSLPEFGIDKMSAKLDSGAVLSSLHATRIERYRKKGETWIRFLTWSDVLGDQSSYRCEARWLSDRTIRSSSGCVEQRPSIETILYIGGFQWPIEVTLCDRSSLECKLLLGRSALAERCLIDCSRQHLYSRP